MARSARSTTRESGRGRKRAGTRGRPPMETDVLTDTLQEPEENVPGRRKWHTTLSENHKRRMLELFGPSWRNIRPQEDGPDFALLLNESPPQEVRGWLPALLEKDRYDTDFWKDWVGQNGRTRVVEFCRMIAEAGKEHLGEGSFLRADFMRAAPPPVYRYVKEHALWDDIGMPSRKNSPKAYEKRSRRALGNPTAKGAAPSPPRPRKEPRPESPAAPKAPRPARISGESTLDGEGAPPKRLSWLFKMGDLPDWFVNSARAETGEHAGRYWADYGKEMGFMIRRYCIMLVHEARKRKPSFSKADFIGSVSEFVGFSVECGNLWEKIGMGEK